MTMIDTVGGGVMGLVLSYDLLKRGIHIWKSLLHTIFDTSFDNVPATCIWSRLVRMTDTCDKSTVKEQMCFLMGSPIVKVA